MHAEPPPCRKHHSYDPPGYYNEPLDELAGGFSSASCYEKIACTKRVLAFPQTVSSFFPCPSQNQVGSITVVIVCTVTYVLLPIFEIM